MSEPAGGPTAARRRMDQESGSWVDFTDSTLRTSIVISRTSPRVDGLDRGRANPRSPFD
jgi:hypothetical protein